MKIRFLTLMAAALVLGLASCSKDRSHNDPDPEIDFEDGSVATMSLSIRMPMATRSGQDGIPVNGADVENTMNTVDVYIFKTDQVMIARGGHTRLDIATDFDVVGTGATAMYTTKTDKRISTISGDVKIYVGVNLPTSFNQEFPTEIELLQQTAVVSGMFSNNNFWMFSDAAKEKLKPYNPADANSVNNVTVSLDRVVAKVAVTAYPVGKVSSGQIKVTWSDAGKSHDGLEMTYTMKSFRPYQDAKVSYVAPNYLVETEAQTFAYYPTENYTGGYKTYSPYGTGSLYAVPESHSRYSLASTTLKNIYTATEPTDLNHLPAYYIGENRDYVTPSANARTTYVMVGTQVSVNKAAKWDTDVVVYEDVAPYGGTGHIYIIKAASYGSAPMVPATTYITNELTKASDIKLGIDAEAGVEHTALIYTFPNGWVHFPVYLDGYKTPHVLNRYGIFRNQFLRVNVANVYAQVGSFPGYPGVSTQPDEPIDPTITDPLNPDPLDPNEPVDNYPAMLGISLQVRPWFYLIQNDVILGGK